MKKYETIIEAMATDEGKALYKVLTKSYDQGLAQSPARVQEVINAHITYLGSQHHIETMVWAVLNHQAQKNTENLQTA